MVKKTVLKRDEKLLVIEENFRNIMEALGLNIDDPSIVDTPKRVAKMYVDELFAGLNEDNEPKVTLFDSDFDNMVITKNIKIKSMCEHHFMPVKGVCHVAYFPGDGKVLGLSKIPRLVRFVAAVPSIQESLVKRVADIIMEKSSAYVVGVYINAHHDCCSMRGAQEDNLEMATYYIARRKKITSKNYMFLEMENLIKSWRNG